MIESHHMIEHLSFEDAEKALAEGDPSFAADLLLSACMVEGEMTRDWDRVRMAVKSCRWSSRR